MATTVTHPEIETKHNGEGGTTVVVSNDAQSTGRERSTHIPLRLKITAVLLVSAIGFGGHWSSGVTSAMKSTLKKVPYCNQSNLLDQS
jgi:hypothetical protein